MSRSLSNKIAGSVLQGYCFVYSSPIEDTPSAQTVTYERYPSALGCKESRNTYHISKHTSYFETHIIFRNTHHISKHISYFETHIIFRNTYHISKHISYFETHIIFPQVARLLKRYL